MGVTATLKFVPLSFIQEDPLDHITNWIPAKLLCCKLISTTFFLKGGVVKTMF